MEFVRSEKSTKTYEPVSVEQLHFELCAVNVYWSLKSNCIARSLLASLQKKLETVNVAM